MRRSAIIHPKEVRHTDMSMMRLKLPNQLSRQQFKDYKTLETQRLNLEDIDVHNPIVHQAQQEMQEQLAIATPMA